MFTNILIAMFVGGFVGILGHRVTHKKYIKPKKTKTSFTLGFFDDMLFGAVGAIGMVLLADTTSIDRVILISIGSGMGGEAILRRLDLSKQNSKIDTHIKEINGRLERELNPENNENNNNQD
ncbi:DUF4257 domain-containing protein [Alkalihalobacillus sp. BA299]|uniref:DUF4257 domain-containing protein n=1 Tax=Alkalihalobacillus sp. BA299 TaxID=2815938 RepID=UPI001ADA4661|nr:DUF4257 domain-containing protein [Alkalihalobacillus sp. BA299]